MLPMKGLLQNVEQEHRDHQQDWKYVVVLHYPFDGAPIDAQKIKIYPMGIASSLFTQKDLSVKCPTWF